MQIERLAFFRYVCETYHSLRVTGTSKYYKTGTDLSLWSFGGDTTEMDISIFSIIKFIHLCWKQRLYLKAICWLKNQDTIEYDINVAALYYYFT